MNYIGVRKYVQNGFEIADMYEKRALADEQAAKVLVERQLYSDAVYLYVQSMEKYIKAHICKKIDVTQSYYADELRSMGHSLDNSIEFLIKILSGNDQTIREQLNKQIISGVFQNIRFSSLHNDLRYPKYHSRTASYSELEISAADCYRTQEIHTCLKNFLKDFYKL